MEAARCVDGARGHARKPKLVGTSPEGAERRLKDEKKENKRAYEKMDIPNNNRKRLKIVRKKVNYRGRNHTT